MFEYLHRRSKKSETAEVSQILTYSVTYTDLCQISNHVAVEDAQFALSPLSLRRPEIIYSPEILVKIRDNDKNTYRVNAKTYIASTAGSSTLLNEKRQIDRE